MKMSEEMLVMHCSPTLAGLKTGNLFSCSYRDSEEVLGFLRRWNTMLREKGIRLLPLRFKNGKAEKAQKQFERFKKCTKVYQKQYANGRPLTKLTVAK